MKYMNHVKSGLLAMAFACAGICFTGCEDDVVINTGNSDKLDTVDGVYGYVKSAAGARELTPISVFGDKVATGHLYFELSKAAEQDVTVTFKVDEDVLEAYNKKNGTSYKMYPADKLSLANGGTATIKAGEQKSASVELNINAGGTIGQTYAVAVSASANNGVEVSTNNQEYIYLVKPLAAIPESISKGDILTHCFVEVNDENILNMGEYTMKSDGKPFFDVVSIFAANINVDSKTRSKAGLQRGTDHRRKILRSIQRTGHRACIAGGGSRRSHCIRGRRRSDRTGCGEQKDRHRGNPGREEDSGGNRRSPGRTESRLEGL